MFEQLDDAMTSLYDRLKSKENTNPNEVIGNNNKVSVLVIFV